ncbi:hypothetical protein BC834DRAFT_971202 [Gloeopeniophorella convolvens]|nr:hypothetical protein BC834DRAFT_971202 [Gloeopeniophorella convolvens]
MSTLASPIVATAACTPKIVRRYHYQHAPPPSDPTEFMVELRRGLRGVQRPGFMGKIKAAGWRILIKIDELFMGGEDTVQIRPDFPVAPPPSPIIPIQIPELTLTRADSPSWQLSPQPAQMDGFLTIPGRVVTKPPVEAMPRVLPTHPPPGPPPQEPLPPIQCCSWANEPPSPSETPSPVTPSSELDDDAAAAAFYSDIMHQMFELDNAVAALQSPDAPVSDPVTSAWNETIAISNVQVQEMRAIAVDTEFLEELGLNAQEWKNILKVGGIFMDEA